ncbi:MAG: NAD(P)H-hydrate dehydratase [Firmicutes bacterium]|nr:NAD(P)H-hydrate dehydratase [Bacillota bacterium]
MKICSVSQMRASDSIASEKYGIPSIVLMENAARACVSEIIGFNSFVVLCGKGNNAGDGLAIARHLINAGKSVKIYLLFGNTFSGDARTNFEILKNMSVQFSDLADGNLENDVKMCDCVVDAVFGTGLRGEIAEDILGVFDTVNNFAKYVLAVDVPSGIDADNGKVFKNAVKANKTVTFAAYKRGLLLFPAADFAGEIKTADISIPKEVFDSVKADVADREKIKSLMPRRQKNSHKGDYGKVLIIGGSEGMAGAVCLAAKAAFMAGAGLVTVCVPKEINDIVQKNVVEAMTISLDFEGEHTRIIEKINDFDVVLFGNGIGRKPFIAGFLENVLAVARVPVIIDADGLFALAQKPELLKLCGENTVLTPHLVEMARLLGISAKDVEDARMDIAYDFAEENGLTLVLKGNHTIITAPDGSQSVNINGNSGMATAGSGDVLAGILAGFMPVCKNTFDCSVLSVYVHGAAGDFAAKTVGETSLIAGNIVSAISHILPVEIPKKI